MILFNTFLNFNVFNLAVVIFLYFVHMNVQNFRYMIFRANHCKICMTNFRFN